MGDILLIILLLILIIILQHIIHEISHVLMAKFKGVSILRIHWFTYSKLLGTRVFYENEPNFNEELIDNKWGWIAGAGFLSTTNLGYLSFLIYYLLKGSIHKKILLILFLVSVVFILTDSFYFFVGALFNFGDVIGIRNVFNLSKVSLLILTTSIFIINSFIVYKFLW